MHSLYHASPALDPSRLYEQSIYHWAVHFVPIFRSARTSYRTFDSRPPVHPSVRPPATIFPELIDELKHCRQASGTPQIVYFLKAHDVSYPNSDKNSNTETNTNTNTNTETNTKTETNKGKTNDTYDVIYF